MGQTFRYKPAMLGASYEVRVDAASAEAVRGSRRQAVRFAEVTDARLVEISMRTSSISLVLMHRNGKFVINHGGRAADAAHDANAAGFVAASVAILEALARVKPGLAVRMGGGPGLRTTMAVMGVLFAFLGLLTAIIPLGHGALDIEGIGFVVMAVVMAAAGAGLAMRYNPLVKLPGVKADELATALRRHLPAA